MLFPFHRFLLLPPMLVLGMCCTAEAQQTLGELYATDARVKGAVVLVGSGTSVLSGSSIAAGAQNATLKLERGGSLLVCSGTNLSVNASQNGRELMFSLNSGNLEMNYPLGAAADTLLTPDLRLLLPGPGTVHIAVKVSPQGDTCVQSLPWNVAAIVVSETMGDATYQVKPDEAVLFKGGHLSEAAATKQNCGCPLSQPIPPTQVAKAAPPPPPAEPKPTPPAPKPAPVDQNVHIAVSAPLVFRADDPAPDLAEIVASLKLEHNQVMQLEPVVLPPPEPKKMHAERRTPGVARKEPKHGFLSKVGAFFATLFH
ncbi:MAG TPA: hypothetical protein VII95_09590 [Terriglobales bacterium]|jgi:hypothetical protein